MRLYSLLAAAALASASIAAHADTFSFSYTAGTISAVGTLTATNEGNQMYQVTAISGQRGGIDIVSLTNYQGADNKLNLATMPQVDYNGLSFLTAAGLNVNLFASQEYPGLVRELTPNGNNPQNGGFALQLAAAPVATTPEPTSLALLGTGLLGAVGAFRKRFV